MRGIRDGLGEWAAARGAEVAAVAESSTFATKRAIRRRRRRRSAAIAGGTAAAIVGVVAIASAALGPTPVPVASNPPTPIGALACEQDWTLEPGATVHDASKAASVMAPKGGWSVFTDGGDVIQNPDSVWAGFESLRWTGTISPDDAFAVRAEVVAVQNGRVVGAHQDQAAGNYVVDGDTLEAYAPYPGTCGGVPSGAGDGDYTYHVVITVSDASTGTPVETFVDPSGDRTVTFSGLDTWSESAVTYPHLREPEGGVYQAFAIQEPSIGSCTPYSDFIARGVPDASALTYDVTIPGVQPLTGEPWGNAPAVVIDNPNYHAWYVGLPTGITAEHVDGGNPLATLAWTTGPAVGETTGTGELRLVNTGDAAPLAQVGQDCVFTQPLPAIAGAVFLIIDGVDAQALDKAYPTVDIAEPDALQTWVYLGQAS